MPRTCFLVFPNQLYERTAAAAAAAGCETALIVEESLFFYDPVHRPVRPNKIKIAYMRACMRRFADRWRGANKTISVSYHDYDGRGIDYAKLTEAFDRVVFFDVTDHALDVKLRAALGRKVHVLESPSFLMARSSLAELASSSSGRLPRHEDFYEFMKKKLGVLEGVKNLDASNRLPPPRDYAPPAELPRFDRARATAKYYREAIAYATSRFPEHVGDAAELSIYPITHTDARKAFARFLDDRLAAFGPYEDAIVEADAFMYHSAISPMLNIGLLDPKWVLAAVLGLSGRVPIESLEGFVRQLIGWREYMRYLYCFVPLDKLAPTTITNTNNRRRFSPASASQWYDGTTGVRPLDAEIKKAVRYGYAHHIVRLMVFMNFFILCEADPRQIYEWFMEVVAMDAYDWVMVSNIYAMGHFSETRALRRPYLSSSAYILKMSDYKKDGHWDRLWTSLFYRFVAREKEKEYVAFYRRNLARLSPTDLAGHAEFAERFIEGKFVLQKDPAHKAA